MSWQNKGVFFIKYLMSFNISQASWLINIDRRSESCEVYDDTTDVDRGHHQVTHN